MNKASLFDMSSRDAFFFILSCLKIIIRSAIRTFLKWTLMLPLFVMAGLAFGLYLHAEPYGNATFDQKEWLLEADIKLQNGDRCAMAKTAVKMLNTMMTRQDVEDILGSGFLREYDGNRQVSYNLGWCSPFAIDSYSLNVAYNKQNRLLEAWNQQD